MARRFEIKELASLPNDRSGLSGKFAILRNRAQATNFTDYIRKLLAAIGPGTFSDLVGKAKGEATSVMELRVADLARMLRDLVSKNQMNNKFEAAIAEFAGFSLVGNQRNIWRIGTAAEFGKILEELEPKTNAPTGASARPPGSGTHSPSDLITMHESPAWSLLPALCSITLFGNDNFGGAFDFELSGGPHIITLNDEAGKSIIKQHKIVVTRCIVEFDFGGAEIGGGTTALNRAVSQFLRRSEAKHLKIRVFGPPSRPTLDVQASGEPIGLVRPLIKPAESEDEADKPLSWLIGVKAGTKIQVRVRLFDSALQDFDLQNTAIAIEGEDEAPIGGENGAPIPVDDRQRIMSHIWKLGAKAASKAHIPELGVITLAYDALIYNERAHEQK